MEKSQMKKELKKIISNYKKLLHREVVINLKCQAKISWCSDTSYEVGEILPLNSDKESKKKLRKYNNELKRFCKIADAYGKKHFNDKWYLWENYLWDISE